MRSPFQQSLTSPGVGLWIRVDHQQRPFNEGMFFSVSEDGAGITGQVEHTPDNPDLFVPVTYTVAATTMTLNTTAPHGLSAGDSVVLEATNFPNAPGQPPTFTYDGQYTVVTTPTPLSLTLTVPGAGPATSPPTAKAALCRVFADTLLNTLTTVRKYGSNTVPVLASRLHVTAITGGVAYLEIVQGHSRG